MGPSSSHSIQVAQFILRNFEAPATIRKDVLKKKIPVYEDLISFKSRILMASKTGKAVTEKEMIEIMSDFTQRSIVWAADDVLNAWIKFRGASIHEAAMKHAPFELMFIYEDLIRAIHKDLGHKNKDLTKGKLLS